MRALIVLGGDRPSAELLQRQAAVADVTICADRGAAHCVYAGVGVDLLVGDLDSLDGALVDSLRRQGVELLQAPQEKDEPDGQLALDAAIERGAEQITLLAATGGRLDHVLGNLQLLLRAAKRGVPARIVDDGSETRAVTGTARINGEPGLTVSLLPAEGDVSVRYLSGLHYGTAEPLSLPWDKPIGVSNRLTAPIAHIVVDGWAYLITSDGR